MLRQVWTICPLQVGLLLRQPLQRIYGQTVIISAERKKGKQKSSDLALAPINPKRTQSL